jgi:hypothetical protein
MKRGFGYTLILSTILALGIGIPSIVSCVKKRNYNNLNWSAITLEKTGRRWYIGPTGEKYLTVKQGESFSVGYGASDKDGLKRLTILLNGNTLDDDIVSENHNHRAGTLADRNSLDLKLSPGEHIFEIKTVDMTGEKRRDVATLKVLEQPYGDN